MIENLFLALAALLILRGLAEELFVRKPFLGGALILILLAALNPRWASQCIEAFAPLVLVLFGLVWPVDRCHGSFSRSSLPPR